MTRTWDDVHELRQRIHKVEDLRDKEQQHGLAEVAENSNNGECHS